MGVGGVDGRFANRPSGEMDGEGVCIEARFFVGGPPQNDMRVEGEGEEGRRLGVGLGLKSGLPPSREQRKEIDGVEGGARF